MRRSVVNKVSLQSRRKNYITLQQNAHLRRTRSSRVLSVRVLDKGDVLVKGLIPMIRCPFLVRLVSIRLVTNAKRLDVLGAPPDDVVIVLRLHVLQFLELEEHRRSDQHYLIIPSLVRRGPVNLLAGTLWVFVLERIERECRDMP